MIYRFKTQASGDVIMLQPHGDQLLRLIGREPAPQGIIEVADMPAARQALETAAEPPADAPAEPEEQAVGLKHRVWPMVEMLKRAHAAGDPIVWGV